MRRSDLGSLDSTRIWWAAAVVAPGRGWSGAPGAHRGSRYLVEGRTFHPSRDEFEAFGSELECLRWIMHHRGALNRACAGAPVRAVRLDRWLLGLD